MSQYFQSCLSLSDSSSGTLAESDSTGLVIRRCNPNNKKYVDQIWFALC